MQILASVYVNGISVDKRHVEYEKEDCQGDISGRGFQVSGSWDGEVWGRTLKCTLLENTIMICNIQYANLKIKKSIFVSRLVSSHPDYMESVQFAVN